MNSLRITNYLLLIIAFCLLLVAAKPASDLLFPPAIAQQAGSITLVVLMGCPNKENKAKCFELPITKEGALLVKVAPQ